MQRGPSLQRQKQLSVFQKLLDQCLAATRNICLKNRSSFPICLRLGSTSIAKREVTGGETMGEGEESLGEGGGGGLRSPRVALMVTCSVFLVLKNAGEEINKINGQRTYS